MPAEMAALFDPVVAGGVPRDNEPANALASWLLVNRAHARVEFTYEKNAPAQVLTIEVGTSLPLDAPPAAYEALTNTGFRLKNAEAKTATFVTSCAPAQVVSPVLGGFLEGTSGRPRHVHCTLRNYHPAAMRTDKTRNLVGTLQDRLTARFWYELHVVRERRRLCRRAPLPAKWRDLLPAAQTQLAGDDVVAMLAFLYVYETCVKAYATETSWSISHGTQYVSRVREDGHTELNSVMVKLIARFRELVDAVALGVPASYTPYEVN